jgi:hypothetical protein
MMEKAVKRGLARRESRPLEDLAVDAMLFQKRHEYVTVLRKGAGQDPSDRASRTGWTGNQPPHLLQARLASEQSHE